MWTWSLNETAVLGFTAWRRGEPNNSWNGGEDCVVLQVLLKLNNKL